MNHVDNKGFTLIELMLAMTFISVLLLGIAMTIIQIGTTYNKGMALKEVNQSARDIGTDVQRSMAAVSAISDDDYVGTTSGGRLCLGTVSYIWNYGKAFAENDPGITWYADDTDHIRKIHLIKIQDSSKIYCAKDGTGVLLHPTVGVSDATPAQDLLKEGDHSLNVHQFLLTSDPAAIDTVTEQRLYALDYTIGSGEITALNDDQTACKAPGEEGADFSYCNVQQFSIVIRAGNRV